MVEYDILPEDFIIRFFPRNLSYSEEGYLDNLSTCSPYVKPARSPGTYISYIQSRVKKTRSELCNHIDCEFDILEHNRGKVEVMADEGTSVDPIGEYPETMDLIQNGSEDGIFLNMMDDLDPKELPERRNSDGSESTYFSMDSVSSPEESHDIKLEEQTCLNNAVSLELQKSELRKIVSDSSIGAIDDSNTNGDGELKKMNSADNLKFAHLKIEVKGGQFLDTDAHKYLINVPESPVYDEPEFNINKAELRKTSSLKSNKTPPGTPSRKKMVRFADAMGLDLESVRHVLDTDNPPKIPASAIADLKVGVEEDRRDVGSRYLDLCFQQPCARENFMTRVIANKVSLENCVITDMSITGVVRVANIGYHKCVRVRYTVNNWVTFYDVMASYVQNSCDGATDRFSFTIVLPSTIGPGSNISFAVSYTVNDQVYWDSNESRNYSIVCYAKSTPSDLDSSWLHFM